MSNRPDRGTNGCRILAWKGTLALAAALSVAAPLAGCGDSKLAGSTLESVVSDPTACQEQHPDSVIAFVVGADGAVRAGATGADGKPAKIEGGTLAFRKDGGPPTEAKLAPEGDGTVASAKGPALDGDVTAMDYAVQVAGKTLKGVLHLPAGGTKTLAETAKTAAPETATGPNGGQVQTVGGEPIEVAVAPNGDVVAYMLDSSRKTMVTTGRTVWLLIDGEKVALAQREDGAFVGRTTVVAPRKITVVLVRDGKRHVVMVGNRPGLKIAADRAPGVVIVKVIAKGPVDKNPDEPGMGHASGKDKKDGDDDDDKPGHGKDKKDEHGHDDKDKGGHGKGNGKGGNKGKK